MTNFEDTCRAILDTVFQAGITVGKLPYDTTDEEYEPNAELARLSKAHAATGLKDNKGQEIYGGDIVIYEKLFQNPVYAYDARPEDEIPGEPWQVTGSEVCEVVFIDGGFCIKQTSLEGQPYYNKLTGNDEFLGTWTGHMRIIGNIKQNPELLEANNATK